MHFNPPNVQTLYADWLINKKISLDVLRLDEIHPVISGNKWFKLKYYLQEAIALQKNTVATFGGAWSNHIAAVAFACKEAALQSVGIIRGEQPAVLSDTLQLAKEYGMELHFVSRQHYRKKEAIKAKYADKNWYWINEGGYGKPGAKGAAEILKTIDASAYTHIIAAAGTGTMLAGLLLSATSKQQVVGISCMKGNFSLQQEIMHLIEDQKPEVSFQIIHDYHFGGYAKCPNSLIVFINNVYDKHQLPLDIIYTGKTFYAIKDLAQNDFFKPESRLLMIHSGGLQGNRSLPEKVLAF